ncbi:MAG: hypothetical protein JRK53_12935 [Deltaproteobacteria bacterium]|nr:hypothetical protein [Deltaproteobacteria bacterium]
MTNKPRYSIKKYILIGVISMTVGVVIGTIILSILGSILGFGSQGVLVTIVLSFPICLFSALYGFYKGLVRHYGFKGDEKLFFGGKF